MNLSGNHVSFRSLLDCCVNRLTASCDIILGVVHGIHVELGVVGWNAGIGSHCVTQFCGDCLGGGVGDIIFGAVPGVLFHVWRWCVRGLARTSICAVGLVVLVISGAFPTLRACSPSEVCGMSELCC